MGTFEFAEPSADQDSQPALSEQLARLAQGSQAIGNLAARDEQPQTEPSNHPTLF